MKQLNFKKTFLIGSLAILGGFTAKAQQVDIVVQSATYNLSNYPNFDPNGSVLGTYTVQIGKDANTYGTEDFNITIALPSASPILGTGIVLPSGFIIEEGGLANDNYVVFKPSVPWTGSGPGNSTKIFTIPVKITATATNQPSNATLQWFNPAITENSSNNSAGTFLNVQNTPLPVKLVSFTAKKEGNTSLLHWTTAAEQNNIGFDIERSQDGKRFTKIGFEATQAINGNSTSALDYTFVDEKPVAGINYYRLKQMDIDGKFVYSDIASVSFGNGTKQAITVYPNPAVNSVTVTAQDVSKIEVYNVMGQLIKVPVNYDVNTSEINIAGLANGNYTLRIVSGADVSNHKLVIKK